MILFTFFKLICFNVCNYAYLTAVFVSKINKTLIKIHQYYNVAIQKQDNQNEYIFLLTLKCTKLDNVSKSKVSKAKSMTQE